MEVQKANPMQRISIIKIVDIRIERQDILHFRTQLISRKETESQRINHKVAQQYTDEEHQCSDSQCFTHALSLIRIRAGLMKRHISKKI